MKNNRKKAAVLCGTMMAASLSLTACVGAATAEAVDLREVPLDTIIEKPRKRARSTRSVCRMTGPTGAAAGPL